jgi:hypothetical protein
VLLTKHHAIKTYWRAEVQLHASLTSAAPISKNTTASFNAVCYQHAGHVTTTLTCSVSVNEGSHIAAQKTNKFDSTDRQTDRQTDTQTCGHSDLYSGGYRLKSRLWEWLHDSPSPAEGNSVHGIIILSLKLATPAKKRTYAIPLTYIHVFIHYLYTLKNVF